MINNVKEFVCSQMDTCTNMLLEQLNSLRSSRVSPDILNTIYVDYLGQKVQLRKLSNIVLEKFNTLKISLFDPSIKKNVEKAIINSNLDLNPISVNNHLQINIPSLTEERRLKLIKLAKSMTENSRVCVRNIRRNANEKIKILLKDKKISNDQEHDFQNEIQKITNIYIKKINIIFNEKEKELLIS